MQKYLKLFQDKKVCFGLKAVFSMFSFSKPTVNIGLEITEITWNWDFYLCLSGNKQSLNWLGLHIESFFPRKYSKLKIWLCINFQASVGEIEKNAHSPRSQVTKILFPPFTVERWEEMQLVCKLIILSWWSSWWSQLWWVGAIIVSWIMDGWIVCFTKRGVGH